MSLLQAARQSPADEEGRPSEKDSAAKTGFMNGHETAVPPLHRPDGLDPHSDARALIRLVQCPQCSRPFRTPVTLPCGHSLCRDCLPSPHRRENISYPDTPDRRQAYICPVNDCCWEHPVVECNIDVTLTKLMEATETEIARHRSEHQDKPILLSYAVRLGSSGEGEKNQQQEEQRSKVLNGCRLVATFTLAGLGELCHDVDVSYQSLSITGDDYRALDDVVLKDLRVSASRELDCQVCYNLMLDPVTTPCGHTYCRDRKSVV